MSAARSPKAAGKRKGGTPPVESRWEKGCRSPNPAGRPRKSQDVPSLVAAELDATIEVSEGGRILRLTKREVMVRQLVARALKGDLKAIDRVVALDRPAAAPTDEASVAESTADQKASEVVMNALVQLGRAAVTAGAPPVAAVSFSAEQDPREDMS